MKIKSLSLRFYFGCIVFAIFGGGGAYLLVKIRDFIQVNYLHRPLTDNESMISHTIFVIMMIVVIKFTVAKSLGEMAEKGKQKKRRKLGLPDFD